MTFFDTELRVFAMSNLKNNPIGVKIHGASNAMDYCFIATLSCNFKCVLQNFHGIEDIKHGL
jgi:UDP-N-acetylglucosamine enolpyruvyl transferase